MKIQRFYVEGEPLAWAAPKVTKRGTFDIRSAYKKSVTWTLTAQKHEFPNTIEGPVRVTIYFFFAVPKSFSKKKQEAIKRGETRHITKPDRTNCLKLFEDCVERAGIIGNDSQIVEGEAKKYYCTYDPPGIRRRYSVPHTYIEITEL